MFSEAVGRGTVGVCFFFPVCSLLRRSSVNDAFSRQCVYKGFFDNPQTSDMTDILLNTLFNFVKGNPKLNLDGD